MKSTHGKFATREDAEKFISVGKPGNLASTYTKADFLTPGKVAEKFKISTEEAKKVMKQMKSHNTSFILNGHMSTAVVNLGKSNSMYLHPMATEVFEKHLNKQRG